MKKQTGKWVRKAEQDIRAARRLILEKPPVHDVVCFHCQQAAEKYLKALLNELSQPIPHTHDLERIHNLLLLHDRSLKRIFRSAVVLSRYAVDYRYPDENATKREAQGAWRNALRIRQEIRVRLGLRP